MGIPSGFIAQGGNIAYCLKLIKNFPVRSGQVEYGSNAYRIVKVGFHQSAYEECLYFGKDTILLVYVDDIIIMNKS